MKRTLLVAAMFGLFAGTAYADHGHGGGGPVIRDHRAPAPAGPVVRDHRGPSGPVVHDRREGGVVVRDRRGPRVEHVRMNGGRYVFRGGVVRTYRRPVIREHYYNVHVRPAIVVEQYDPVPGYMWVHGDWAWGGSEWVWQPGYWSVAAEEPPPPPAPVVQGGVGISIGGGISIH
jgi:hypothetical protein